MEATAGPAALANCGGRNRLKKSGRNARPLVSTMPTSSAPTNAPRTEPMPPITITTKARIRMFSRMPTCTAKIGRRIEQHRLRAPHDAHQLVRDQDDGEGGEHLRQVIAPVEAAQERDLEQRANDGSGDQCERQPEPERARRLREARHEVRADHVKR